MSYGIESNSLSFMNFLQDEIGAYSIVDVATISNLDQRIFSIKCNDGGHETVLESESKYRLKLTHELTLDNLTGVTMVQLIEVQTHPHDTSSQQKLQ
jgi:hypothetical protein